MQIGRRPGVNVIAVRGDNAMTSSGFKSFLACCCQLLLEFDDPPLLELPWAPLDTL